MGSHGSRAFMTAGPANKPAAQSDHAATRRGHAIGLVRTCPTCQHDHAVGTTCRECPGCQTLDLTGVTREVFAGLLPGGGDAQAALARHNENLRLHARCDGGCGVPDCRKPYFDDAGLTRYRSDDQEIGKES
jgi:hypothetical protein